MKTLRLFVAIYPPPDIARALLDELPRLDLPPHRSVPVEQVHLTVHFIGDTPAAGLDGVTESVRRAGGGLAGFDLAPERLIALPRRGRKRLVAAEADGPASLLELQQRLVTRLAQEPRRRRGDRFLPHLTLCRFRAPSAMRPLERELDVGVFRVDRYRLMRSILRPTGAEHREVAVLELS